MDTVQLVTGAHTCPECESGRMTVQREMDEFQYGAGESAVTLSAYIPIHKCDDCGYEYVDEVGMQMRHAAVCKHLGLLTPAEIKEIRVKRMLSQKAFSELTGIGVASIARWETGSLLQNKSHDNLLRFCSFPDNIERSKAWADNHNKQVIERAKKFVGRGLSPKDVEKYSNSQSVFTLQKYR